MRLRGILLTIVILAALLLAVLNMETLTTRVPLDLAVVRTTFPLGLALLIAVVVVALVFFLAALADRAGQLRQLTHIERQAESLRQKLEAYEAGEVNRVEERLSAAAATLDERLDDVTRSLREQLEAGVADLTAKMRQQLETVEAQDAARHAELTERIAVLRNELAADVAQTEDTLLRRLARGEGDQGAVDLGTTNDET
jgi:DNA anti-recombination protein RmuC